MGGGRRVQIRNLDLCKATIFMDVHPTPQTALIFSDRNTLTASHHLGACRLQVETTEGEAQGTQVASAKGTEQLQILQQNTGRFSSSGLCCMPHHA